MAQGFNSSFDPSRLKSPRHSIVMSHHQSQPLLQQPGQYGMSALPHYHQGLQMHSQQLDYAMQQQMLSDFSQASMMPSIMGPPQSTLPPDHYAQYLPNGLSFDGDQSGAYFGVPSYNDAAMHATPSPEGFPTPEMFDTIVNEYIMALSPKKRDKALIPQKRYDNILLVLRDKKCTTIESAQFRYVGPTRFSRELYAFRQLHLDAFGNGAIAVFWAKKMFGLGKSSHAPMGEVVMHEGKPVAVRENLYKVLTDAHGFCQHGGRDKTSTQVRKYWSWVPKELIARFVRHCPTCVVRRNPAGYDLVAPTVSRKGQSGQTTPPASATSSSSPIGFASAHPTPAHPLSPADSRRTSLISPSAQSSVNSANILSSLGHAIPDHHLPPTPADSRGDAAPMEFSYGHAPELLQTVGGTHNYGPTGSFGYGQQMMYPTGGQ
ncbi:MAG: hypothetical protein M1817_003647 [Caeruleum heppii]|nr:MAG: hypothetical protein M1817_003647 [Caeruleum heppii]